MNTEFPKSENKFLQASMFQDQEIPLTYLGWERKGNEDITTSKGLISWKERLKYQLRYSFPEWAMDEAGEKRLDKNGNPFRNKYFDSAFPKGYSIVYHFQEGTLESGSLPLFEAFCLVRPRPNELISIGRTGKEKDTKWSVKKITSVGASTTDDVPTIQLDESELQPDSEIPF
jgi:hypothetical protein